MQKIVGTYQVREVSEVRLFSSWSPPPKNLPLGNNEVHVWRASLKLEDPYVYSLKQILSAVEQARAERFHFQKDRERFIVAHGLLSLILSRYLNVEPSQLRFCYNRYGKPALASESGSNGLRFNLSHSHEVALYAITRGREVGVDIEHIRSDMAEAQVAKRFFSAREIAEFRSLPPKMQTEGFFNCWTRKEVYVEARGEGLTLPLDQFDVSLAPGEPAALLSTNDDPEEASRRCLQDSSPGPGYVAALAVEGHNWRLKCWQWQFNRLI